ncbi:MAG: hypothetical protein FJX68_18695 [Alphaproteobacteria bacterium]|nr:hypothetical protein [Alphaproteobacteria bacterium]
MFDSMRGLPVAGGTPKGLLANVNDAETNSSSDYASPTATGFKNAVNDSATYIYLAIRRGPMKTPTTGTQVYNAVAYSGNGSARSITGAGFAPDTVLTMMRTSLLGPSDYSKWFFDRIRGYGTYLNTASTNAESAVGSTTLTSFDMDGASLGTFIPNRTYETYVGQFFRRAPGVFDVVCYTGNGPGTQVINHNLGVTPELSIFKSRSGTGGWTVYNGATQFLRLNETTAGATDGSISPTTTSVTVSSSLGFGFNAAGVTYVAYLFATLPGISKVGSYTGTGTTQVIDCGFTTGARFVLIKRTNSTGDWFVYDTVRGIVSGNDPYLLLNSTSAEVTNTDYIDPANSGFEISSTAPAGINANGGTFIFLAVS